MGWRSRFKPDPTCVVWPGYISTRCVVLTDKQWISKVGEFKGSLFAGMDVKAFELTEVAEAEAWLEGE